MKPPDRAGGRRPASGRGQHSEPGEDEAVASHVGSFVRQWRAKRSAAGDSRGIAGDGRTTSAFDEPIDAGRFTDRRTASNVTRPCMRAFQVPAGATRPYSEGRTTTCASPRAAPPPARPWSLLDWPARNGAGRRGQQRRPRSRQPGQDQERHLPARRRHGPHPRDRRPRALLRRRRPARHGAVPGRRPGQHVRRADELRPARRAATSSPNYVTDSASAATAWASGVKTYNAALGVDAKGKVVPTIMELAKEAGLRTGNVSTAEITDATPAGQMSHALLRGCQGPTYSAAPARTPRYRQRAPDRRRAGHPGRRADRAQQHRRRDPRRRPVPLRRRRRGRARGAAATTCSARRRARPSATEDRPRRRERPRRSSRCSTGQPDRREVQAREPGVGAGPGADRSPR